MMSRLGREECTFAAERAAPPAVADVSNWHVGRPIARPAGKIGYARLFKAQGSSLG
jgi:hypothetical protein